MHHEHHRPIKTGRQAERKEWGHDDEHEHQAPTREHARLGNRTRLTQGAREAEARHQIRELRARY